MTQYLSFLFCGLIGWLCLVVPRSADASGSKSTPRCRYREGPQAQVLVLTELKSLLEKAYELVSHPCLDPKFVAEIEEDSREPYLTEITNHILEMILSDRSLGAHSLRRGLSPLSAAVETKEDGRMAVLQEITSARFAQLAVAFFAVSDALGPNYRQIADYIKLVNELEEGNGTVEYLSILYISSAPSWDEIHANLSALSKLKSQDQHMAFLKLWTFRISLVQEVHRPKNIVLRSVADPQTVMSWQPNCEYHVLARAVAPGTGQAF